MTVGGSAVAGCTQNGEFDFRPGIPDASRFPFAAWRGRISRQIRPRVVGAGTLIDAAGHAGLRASIARHVGMSRAGRASAGEVLITSGSQQALDIIARVLSEPGDTVALEEPGYPLPRRLFRSHGARVIGVHVDDEGLILDRIPEGTRVVYVTPSHQCPLGMAMSRGRRQALLAWAERADAAVIEDDYDIIRPDTDIATISRGPLDEIGAHTRTAISV